MKKSYEIELPEGYSEAYTVDAKKGKTVLLMNLACLAITAAVIAIAWLIIKPKNYFENYDFLHQNGIIFWLKRDIDQLPREGRPLSAGDLAAMYEKRKACYEKFADHIVDNNGTVEDTVQTILDCLK